MRTTVFTKLDSFNQIPIVDKDIKKTTTTTPFGLYEFTRMPFGLRNDAKTFQRLIDEVSRGFPFAFAYIDDVLITSHDSKKHQSHM